VPTLPAMLFAHRTNLSLSLFYKPPASPPTFPPEKSETKAEENRTKAGGKSIKQQEVEFGVGSTSTVEYSDSNGFFKVNMFYNNRLEIQLRNTISLLGTYKKYFYLLNYVHNGIFI